MKRKVPPAAWILIAMVIGIILGYMIFTSFPDKKSAAEIAGYVSIVSDMFLRLIKMLIGPLVFSTLVVGIAHMGDAALGGAGVRQGDRLVRHRLAGLAGPRPGDGQPARAGQEPGPAAARHRRLGQPRHREVHVQGLRQPPGPKSFAEAMANNEILQIVVFSMFFGVALASLGEKAKTLIAAIDELAHAMLKITGYVMKLAPLAVMAAMAATVAVNGLEILLKFAVFMGDFYISLILLWGVLVAAGFVFLGPRVFKLLVLIKEAFLLSFATASSEAAYPKILDALDRFGVKRKISSFVMPMGYSFNLDGSMMYCTFAVLFIAQAYDIHLPIGTQVTMLLILMLTSKGMAGVPRASLVVIAATLNQFTIPEAGLLLILGVDTFLDMGRSATNAVGNSIATRGRGEVGRRADARGRSRGQRARARRRRRRCRCRRTPEDGAMCGDLVRRWRAPVAALLLAAATQVAAQGRPAPS